MDNQEEMRQKLQQKFEAAYQAEAAKNKRPNILVCGYTGAGKSSLIKAVLGDIVPADIIGSGMPQTQDYHLYEADEGSLGDVAVWDSKGFEAGETADEFFERTRNFIGECGKVLDPDKHVHLVWYAISGPTARVTECDLELAKKIASLKNVLIVITKSDITHSKQKDDLKKALLDHDIPESRIIFTASEEVLETQESLKCMGCKELVEKSLELLPEAYREAFIGAQVSDAECKLKMIEGKSKKAKSIITASVAAAVGIAATPIPMSDAPLLMGIQTGMIASLAALYGLKGKELSVLAMPLVTKVAGMFLASSITKFFPGLGSVISATVAGTLTTAMGTFVYPQFEKAAIAKATGLPVPGFVFDFEAFNRVWETIKTVKSASV